MAWTEEDREDLLRRLERDFTPEQIARLPEEVQRGDRYCNDGPEWDLWVKMTKEFTYKKAKRQVDSIASLPPEYQAEFPEEVRQGKRAMTKDESMMLRQFVFEARTILHYFGDKDSEEGGTTADLVPDEMYVLLYHDGQAGRFPDAEEVQWYKMDEDYSDEPGPRFSYSRQGQRGVSLPIPTYDAWRRFFARIDEIGAFSWETVEVPDTEGRMDGEPPVWTLEIYRSGVKTFEREGPIDKLPPNFDKFCEALSELMGGQRFGVE